MTAMWINELPRHVGETVTVRGWVVTTRSSGKIAFLVLRDGTGTVQGVLSKKEVSEDTWNAFDIVGHLISGERTDWMPRVGIMLENGEARPFDPFDRFAQLKESQDKSLEQLLDDFARLRRENLAALQALNLQHEDLTRRGRHPGGR